MLGAKGLTNFTSKFSEYSSQALEFAKNNKAKIGISAGLLAIGAGSAWAVKHHHQGQKLDTKA